jgi:hypothetical protein
LNFLEWTDVKGIARILNMSDERALPWLLETYGGRRSTVLQTVLAHAFSLGARCCVIEYRYLDPDWRSEHRAFYASTFRRYPSIAHRLHFFLEPPSDDLRARDRPANFQGLTYLGYCVLRPVAGAPVGRTFLKPRTFEDLTCCTTDKTSAVERHLEHGRPLPSPGLTIGQIADAARAIGLPPLVYPLRHLARGETIPGVICRYLNSGLPVTVATHAHAFVLVGYGRSRDAEGNNTVHFIRQDDEAGPYRRIDSWMLDNYGIWEYAIVPLPEKVYLPGENAEAIGSELILSELERSPNRGAAELLDRHGRHTLIFRSTVVESNEFKRTLPNRGYADAVAAAYQRMQLSRLVWVVELTDPEALDSGEPCVLAEAVIDATEHLRDLHVLGWRIPGALWGWIPDRDEKATLDGLAPTNPTVSIARPRTPVPP